jgi:hypothetical protein
MTLIRNIFNNGGRNNARTGVIRINGGNNFKGGTIALDNTTVGILLDNDYHLNMGDYFLAESDDGATNLLLLPDNGVAWSTSTAYVVNEKVISVGVTYLVIAAHTSDTIAADLLSGDITVFNGSKVTVGTQFTLFCVDDFAIRSQTKAIKLNTVAGSSKTWTTVAADTIYFTYISDTLGWGQRVFTSAGVGKAGTPVT